MGHFIGVVPGLGCYGIMGDSTDQEQFIPSCRYSGYKERPESGLQLKLLSLQP